MKKSGKFPHRPSLRIDSLVYNRPVLLQTRKAMQSEHNPPLLHSVGTEHTDLLLLLQFTRIFIQ